MQPMTAKNRTSVLVGVALLALVVGGFALWSSRRTAATRPPTQSAALNGDTTTASTAPQTGATSPTTGAGPVTAPTDAAHAGMPATAPKSTATIPDTYVVAAGDTLSSISTKFYSTDKYYGDIEYANKLEDPNSLMPGTTLKLPKLEQIQGTAESH